MRDKTILSDKEHLFQDSSDFIGEPQIDIIFIFWSNCCRKRDTSICIVKKSLFFFFYDFLFLIKEGNKASIIQ